MPYRGMAVQARRGLGRSRTVRHRIDLVRDLCVAVSAGIFDDLPIVRRNLNLVRKISRGERPGVEDAVATLAVIFAQQIVWCMAIVTGGKSPV